MRSEDQGRALEEVVTRLVERTVAAGGQRLEAVLADAVYHERQRLEKDRSREGRQERARWEGLRARLGGGSFEERRRILRDVVEGFTREVIGHFDPRIHAVATRAVPLGLSALLHATSPRQLLRRFPDLSLDDRIVVDGEVEHARALRERGTLVCTPTHSSNLDSIVLGYAMHQHGFPPLLYGAGKNLFENPLVGFFMHHLGAYKVDRRKTAPLYREVLKEFATVSLEYGYDNLFFPGGTRCRSGVVEQKLKLGLLGTGLRAMANNLRSGRPRPGIYVVPMVLSYELVLEAETLIDDHLREVGKARYIITDDEFASPRRWLAFLQSVLELDARIHLTFLPPLDPFGNRVDREGRSLDGRGRPIDPARYLLDPDGRIVDDEARDHEYTRELGERLADAFKRGNTVMATHLVAWAAWSELRRQNPGLDLYRFLRTGGDVPTLPFARLVQAVEALRARLSELAQDGRLRLSERVRALAPDELLLAALRSLGTYHSRPALERVGDRVHARDRALLLYYRNRLTGYGLDGDDER